MHEVSIAMALVDQIGKIVKTEGATRARAVTVAVGVLSGVEPHALEMAFPVVAEDAGMKGLQLIMERVESKVRCRACGGVFSLDTPFSICEKCDSPDIEIISGRELSILSLKIDLPDSDEPKTNFDSA